MDKPIVAGGSTGDELEWRRQFLGLMRNCPVPDGEFLSNLGLFLNRQTLTRILFLHFLYRRILRVHGIVVEFGVRWGQSLALFNSFRGMYEPFNYSRRIVGFDSFEGYPRVHEKDGNADCIREGAYGVSKGYERYLEEILSYHERENPISHKKKHELVKGDAVEEIDRYLERNPETIIALAYFDFDLYSPTLNCLESIKGHLTRGSVIGFDELGSRVFPGETLALKEALGLRDVRIRRVPWSPGTSYIVIGG